MTTSDGLVIHPEVAQALAAGQPVVALESTVITHGLPRPVNFELACELEALVREAGAVPATVAVLKGRACIGVDRPELERLALRSTPRKLSRRELGIAAVDGEDGGTTVAATAHLAHWAGIRVFATGGIGGVHRGAGGDVSADLPALAEIPILVVCAGAKVILDLPRTLEWLETAGVPILGWETDEFPAFVCASSGLKLTQRVDSLERAASIAIAHWQTGLRSAVLLAAPCPADAALPLEQVQAVLAEAERGAESEGLTGGAVTPYLVARLNELTAGASLQANLALLRHNARLAAGLAGALA